MAQTKLKDSQVNLSSFAAPQIVVANEATDASCFLTFVVSATGSLELKSNANLTFDSSTGQLQAAIISAASNFVPDTSDGAGLGTSSLQFSDLYLASGALIDFANNDARITHSSGVLTVSTGDFRITTAGTNSASVATVGGSQTLTGKQYQLTASPGSDHTANGTVIILTANENQNFGDVCFINSSGKAQLGDADAIATASCIVMCTETVTANNTAVYLLNGVARDDTWAWTIGGLVYLTVTGTTGNTLSQTAPTGTDDVVQILGVALSADVMYFNPQLVQVELA